MSNYSGVDREAIWTGLLSYFQNELSGTFITMGRRHIQPPNLPLEEQPAFFLVQIRERRSGGSRGLPNTLTLHGYIILYVPAPVIDEAPGQESQLAATVLNQAFLAIDNALTPDSNSGKFTIGGLVDSCFIDGEVEQDPGLFSTQAAAVIPIQILVP